LWIAFVAPVLALLAPLGAQTTWVVPTNAPTVQAAVQAAAPGDVVTMAPGHVDSTGHVVISKAITLRDCIFGGGFTPIIFGDIITVNGIAGGNRILLQRIQLNHRWDSNLNIANSASGIVVAFPSGSAGQLVMDQVTYQCDFPTFPKSGLMVNALAGVRLVARNCQFYGSSGDMPLLSQGEVGFTPGSGVVIGSAGRYLFENCTMLGGRGGDAYWNAMSWLRAKDGAPGLAFAANMPASAVVEVALVNCDIFEGRGGNSGGYGTQFPPPSPCDIAAQPGNSNLGICSVYGVTRHPGVPGGVAGCSNTYPTPAAQTLGAAIDLQVTPSECSAGQQFSMQVAVQPSTLTGLYMGFPLRRSVLPGVVGPLWMDAVAFGTVVPPPNANGWSTYMLPPVPAGLPSAIDICVQPVHIGANYTVVFGNPRMITAR
jgi:hypothetical protein